VVCGEQPSKIADHRPAFVVTMREAHWSLAVSQALRHSIEEHELFLDLAKGEIVTWAGKLNCCICRKGE
jgi:hypothetical protein